VGRAKTSAGTGRQIPMNNDLFLLLTLHAEWFTGKFGETRPEYYLFPFGKPAPSDPTRPTTTLKTVWGSIRDEAKVSCRLHDLRHTAATKMAEAGTPESTMLVASQVRFQYPCNGVDARCAFLHRGAHKGPLQFPPPVLLGFPCQRQQVRFGRLSDLPARDRELVPPDLRLYQFPGLLVPVLRPIDCHATLSASPPSSASPPASPTAPPPPSSQPQFSFRGSVS